MRFVELAEVPGEGRVFEHQMLPGIADVSPTHRARLRARSLRRRALHTSVHGPSARVEAVAVWVYLGPLT